MKNLVLASVDNIVIIVIFLVLIVGVAVFFIIKQSLKDKKEQDEFKAKADERSAARRERRQKYNK